MSNQPEVTNDQVRDFVIAGHGDLTKVIAMLADHPELLNIPYEWNPDDHETALQGAVQTGSTEITEYLLAQGSPLDICTAAMLGRNQEVEGFLEADPTLANAVGAHGTPILPLAAWSGNLALLKLLEERGAKSGAALALFNAVSRGNDQVAQWLLENLELDLSEQNYQGKTVLAVAVERQQEAIVHMLREHGATE